MEEARGIIRARFLSAPELGWKIGIRVRGVVLLFDATCLRDHVSRPHPAHGFHSLVPRRQMSVCPTEWNCRIPRFRHHT